ncbi:hypothetical protein [Priestia megaterium]|uniref:hypothetical protein n=1 Tax=Priestia megaterium TaxID=1404 RepID=UPI002FFDBED0
MKRRLHVVKVPTTNKDLLPYSHFNDHEHDPFILARKDKNGNLELFIEDLFKLKPNFLKRPQNRIDIYMPYITALELGTDIIQLIGCGRIGELANVDPLAVQVANGVRGVLPKIFETRSVRYLSASMRIADVEVKGNSRPIYIDREAPQENHIEMAGAEVHLGMALNSVQGSINEALVVEKEIPEHEVRRKNGETNPMKKAQGQLKLVLSPVEGQNLAATLLYYYQHQSQSVK